MRLGAFGDVVRTLPAVWALRRRHPDARLAWLVEPGASALLERLSWLDEVIVFPRGDLEDALAARRPRALGGALRAVRRRLHAARFDCVVDFHGHLKSGLLCRLTAAPRRVGLAAEHAREGAALFYTERVALAHEPCSRWTRNAALAAHLGARVDASPIPGLAPASAPAPAPAHAPAPAAAGRARGTHAVLHPGTSAGTPYKRYPTDAFAEVARRLTARLGAPCVVTCGSGAEERSLARALVARAGAAARLVDTGGDVEALVRQLAGARLVVSGDTGPLHLASLLGTPVVQILGPTHPVENEPWPHTRWARAEHPLHCRPCRRGCTAAPCMTDLAPDVVVAAAGEVLDVEAPEPAGLPHAARGAVA